jgi:glutamate synthase domain-containing protein 3
MPDNLLEILQKYWLVVTGFTSAIVYFVTTRGNTESNTDAIEVEKKEREEADERLKEEIKRVEERLIARQDSDTKHINERFDDLKGDMSEIRKSVNELLRRKG